MPDGASRSITVPDEAAEMMSPAAVIVSVVPAVTRSVLSTVMPESSLRGVTAATVQIVRSSMSRNTIEPVLAASVPMSLPTSSRFHLVPAPSRPTAAARIARLWSTREGVPPETVTRRAVPAPTSMPVTVAVGRESRPSSIVVIGEMM